MLWGGGHHFFQPAASLWLASAACFVGILALGVARSWSEEEPRDKVLRLVCAAAELPRELQRAMALEFRRAFPDAPAIRDFRAIATRAADATAEVRRLHGGKSGAATAARGGARRGSWVDLQGRSYGGSWMEDEEPVSRTSTMREWMSQFFRPRAEAAQVTLSLFICCLLICFF